MALARCVVARGLAIALLACMAAVALAGSAAAEQPQGLLERAGSGVQRTLADVGAVPEQVAKAVPSNLPGPATVPPVVPAAAQGAGDVVSGVAGAVSDGAAPVGELAGAVAHALPRPAPVAHALQPVGRGLERVGATVQETVQRPSQRPSTAPPAPAAAKADAPSSGGGAPPYAPATGTRLPGAAAPGTATGAPGSAPQSPVLAATPLAMPDLTISAQAPHAGSGDAAGARPDGGRRSPAQPLGQGGSPPQALAGAGGGAALAIVLVSLLLAWAACFARRLRPAADEVPDVRHLLILERPG